MHAAPIEDLANVDSRPVDVTAVVGVAGFAAALLTVLGFAGGWIVVGSISGGWTYPTFRSFTPWLLLPAAGSMAMVLAVKLAVWTLDLSEALSVLVVAAAGFGLQTLLRVFSLAPISVLVRSDASNGFYRSAQRFGIRDFLSDHARVATLLPAHVRTNMPGKFILSRALFLASGNAATMGTWVMVLAALAAIAVYLVARDVGDDRRGALFAMAVYLLMPGRIGFLPVLNTLTPGIALMVFWLFLRALRAPSPSTGAAFGLAAFVLVVFEPLPLAMGLMFLAMLWAVRGEGKRPAAYAGTGLAAILAFLAAYGVLRVWSSYDVFQNLWYVIRDAHSFNEGARPYLPWVGANLLEFALAAGVSSAVVFLVALTGPEAPRWTRAARWFAASCLATIVVLDLLGLNRGEVTRLWIFLAACVAVVTGLRLSGSRSLTPLTLVILGLSMQVAVECGMIAFIVP